MLIAASAFAHVAALCVVLAIAIGRTAATPPDPDLVRGAISRAEAALGGRYDVSVRGASWTLAGGTLGLSLDGLRLDPRGEAPDEAPGLSVRRAVATLGLGGSLRALRLDGPEPALGPAGSGPVDLAPLEAALTGGLAPVLERLARLGLERVEISDIRPPRALGRERGRRLAVPAVYPHAITLARSEAGFDVEIALRVREAVLPVAGTLSRAGELMLSARGTPLSDVWSSKGFGTDAPLDAVLTAGPGSAVALDLSLGAAPLRLGEQAALLDAFAGRVVLHGGGLRIVRLAATVGGNRLDATGAASIRRDADGAPLAIFELDVADALLAPADIAAPALPVAADVRGAIDFRERSIELADVRVRGEGLDIGGTARFGLRGPTPAVRLDLAVGRAPATTLASLWPSWIAGDARAWLAKNVTDGELDRGSLAIDLAAGRIDTLAEAPLTSDELRASGRVTGGATHLFGDLPPLREAAAEIMYAGTRLTVDLASGTTGNPLARVPLARSSFVLLDTSNEGLPARFDIAVSGRASALGALADAQPIGALTAAGFAPDELDGTATGRLTGTVMLREPERRDWALDLNLDRVALLRELEGHRIGGLTGRLRANPAGVTLAADGLLDGIRARFDVHEPIEQIEPIALPIPEMEPRRRIEMTLDRKALTEVSPGLAALMTGSVDIEASVGEGGASVTVDLRDAAIDLSWIGWTKGRGIPATARFEVAANGRDMRIDDLVIEGRGFGAAGSARLDANGLARLTLDRASLTRGDSLALDVTRRAGRWMVDVTGRRFDARGLLTAIDPRDGSGEGSADGGEGEPVTVNARIDTVRGHGGVEARGVRVRYASGRSGMEAVELRGAMGARQIVADGGANDVFVTTDDLGSVLRFLDLYGRVRGGVLTASLGRRGGAWTGEVAASDVAILDEPKLRVMASKVSRRGRIDGSRVRLSRASVNVTYDDGTIRLADGIVRGPEVGAAFAGTLVDASGRIALTGTFLPAYGLNRIFGEIPVLGAVLGNGGQKGLIGLTFRLSGITRRPQIEVNPLSALAPGVLRRIFEYR